LIVEEINCLLQRGRKICTTSSAQKPQRLGDVLAVLTEQHEAKAQQRLALPLKRDCAAPNLVVDPHLATVSNQYQLTFTSDGVDRGPFQFPGNIGLHVIDQDDPADTVTGLGLEQPLDTLMTISDGGVDRVVASMGAMANGVFSTLTSGDGGIRVVPTPGAAALLGVAGLMAFRRRRV